MAVRPLTDDDLPRLPALHRAAFGTGGRPDAVIDDFYQRVFPHLFGPTEPGAPEVPSLVYENEGRLVGLVGVAVRQFSFESEPVWAAVTSQLSVDPAAGNSLAALQLVRQVFDGPQDLTLADRSNPAGRATLVAAGGETMAGYGLRFARVVRPLAAATASLGRRRPGAPTRALAWLAGQVEGYLPARVTSRVELPPAPRSLTGGPVSAAEMADRATAILAPAALHPRLEDADSVQWRIDRLADAQPSGTQEWVGLRTAKGMLVGWYVLHQPEPERAELVELVAEPRYRPAALAHALHRAVERGAASVHGDVSPQLQVGLADAGALFHGRNASFTVHSRHPELLAPFRTGHAFISGLDGEYLLDLASHHRS